MADFRHTGEHLRRRYNGAVRVAVNQYGTGFTPAHTHFKRPSKNDLVYLEDSPDYCIRDPDSGKLCTWQPCFFNPALDNLTLSKFYEQFNIQLPPFLQITYPLNYCRGLTKKLFFVRISSLNSCTRLWHHVRDPVTSVSIVQSWRQRPWSQPLNWDPLWLLCLFLILAWPKCRTISLIMFYPHLHFTSGCWTCSLVPLMWNSRCGEQPLPPSFSKIFF